jgi:hypothetical protein
MKGMQARMASPAWMMLFLLHPPSALHQSQQSLRVHARDASHI